MQLLKLMWEFLQIGFLCYGGGIGLISYIQKVTARHGWLTLEQFSDMIALSQITPGPIAINIATYVGYNVAGLTGAVIATMAMIMPSFVLVMIITHLLTKYDQTKWMESVLDGLRAVVLALIISAVVPLGTVAFEGLGNSQWLAIIPLSYSIWAAYSKKNILITLVVTGLWGLIL